MNKNDNLMIPYYQSKNWMNILEERIKTLKDDSLLLKACDSSGKKQRGKSSSTNRIILERKQSNLPTLNTLKKNSNIKDILNDISLDNLSHCNDKSIFRHTSTSFTYRKMKIRWNQKLNKRETSPLIQTHLVFPSTETTLKPSIKIKNIDDYHKTKYLLFLNKKGMMKTNLYYNNWK